MTEIDEAKERLAAALNAAFAETEAESEALRQRAEAAEAALTEARAQMDAEWNAAIDAAAEVAADEDGALTTCGQDKNTVICQNVASDIADAIRALHRPAKTAGEGE